MNPTNIWTKNIPQENSYFWMCIKKKEDNIFSAPTMVETFYGEILYGYPFCILLMNGRNCHYFDEEKNDYLFLKVEIPTL